MKMFGISQVSCFKKLWRWLSVSVQPQAPALADQAGRGSSVRKGTPSPRSIFPGNETGAKGLSSTIWFSIARDAFPSMLPALMAITRNCEIDQLHLTLEQYFQRGLMFRLHGVLE
jgi:hypothetical protein